MISSTPLKLPLPPAAQPFLEGGGELASLIASFDWSTTSLGPILNWPQSVKSTVALVLRSHVPIVTLWGADGVMIYNDAYAVFAAGRHPQLLGSKVREGWVEVSEFNDNVMRVGLSGGTLAYKDQELTLCRSGRPEQVWMDLDYSPILDEAGQPAGVIAVVVDTTEKVLAERWLKGEQERLRQMFQQAPGFMAMLRGPQHVFEFVNAAYQEMIGRRELGGLSVRDALPELAGQGVFEVLDRVFSTGVAASGLARPLAIRRTPGGEPHQRYIDVMYQPVRDPRGEVVGIFVQGSDVTDRIAAEQEVRASEVRHRQILDSAMDYAIVATDLEGRVTCWNKGAHKILGWTEQEMIGQPIEQMFTAADRTAGIPAAKMRHALESRRVRDERWHVRRSGAQFWANVELTPILDETGRAVGFVNVLRDWTQEHRAREALTQADAQLRRAQEAGGVGVFTIDLVKNLLHATPEFCRIYGLEERSPMPATVIEGLVIREDASLVSDTARRASGEAPLDVEYRIRRPDTGELRAIARKGEYEFDASGRPLRMVGVVHDVTERRAVQRALEESAAQFRTFAQAMANQVWTALPDGRLDWFNERTYEYNGARYGELDGSGWLRTVHAEDRDTTAQRWAASLATGTIFEIEFRLRRADGAYRWHLARALPIRGANDAITKWIGTSTDIHERKTAEAENVRDRDRMWAMSQDLMLVCDFDGVITAVNPSATRLLGWDQAELLGHRLVDLLHPDDVARTAREVARLSEGASTLAFENRYRTKDGRFRLLDWTAVPDAGRIHAVGRDITDQRTAEDALRQSQKMEAVGQLTGGIAHDFNNLLLGITGSLDLIQKRIGQGRLTELDRFVSGAMTSANRASALTHRLLAFSRRQPLDPRPVRPNPLVASMEDLLRRTLGERVELELMLAGGLWLTRCDANQLESAILNLAINSRDAMPGGGRLTIETSNAHLDSASSAQQSEVRPGQYICICVTDTGTGMSAETVAKAFEPFFTTKPIGQGTGLGLSMIYGFARQSEGYARIFSELGRGTTFKLYLPRHRGEAEEDEEAPSLSDAHAAEAGETVLVVEDEPVVRGLIVEVLSDLGYRALEAADGPKGLEVLQSPCRIDLLVTDVGLPGLNGRQVADAGRALRPELKVLFMTGYAESAALASGFLEPGMQMVTKPFAMEAMASRIRDMIGS